MIGCLKLGHSEQVEQKKMDSKEPAMSAIAWSTVNQKYLHTVWKYLFSQWHVCKKIAGINECLIKEKQPSLKIIIYGQFSTVAGNIPTYHAM